MAEALGTVGQYVGEARTLLQDKFAPYRYSDADLVDALNIALTEIRRIRSDLLLPKFEIPYFDTAGTINMTAEVPFEPGYRSALVYYITGRAQLRDDENNQDGRAAALLTKFTKQLLSIDS